MTSSLAVIVAIAFICLCVVAIFMANRKAPTDNPPSNPQSRSSRPRREQN